MGKRSKFGLCRISQSKGSIGATGNLGSQAYCTMHVRNAISITRHGKHGGYRPMMHVPMVFPLGEERVCAALV